MPPARVDEILAKSWKNTGCRDVVAVAGGLAREARRTARGMRASEPASGAA
ncbi:hypothetical protein FTUN_0173 [Frigoriglobus tundricola]|uniref:Uncharacterized protein n=1 Tax=Frigoriglobus tundricola TaxID=2774151 RepID=A0A6M5YHD1_9BACT|nr:hypothetical protein FTUN_0173 [Frigoriglobus tundricola]